MKNIPGSLRVNAQLGDTNPRVPDLRQKKPFSLEHRAGAMCGTEWIQSHPQSPHTDTKPLCKLQKEQQEMAGGIYSRIVFILK